MLATQDHVRSALRRELTETELEWVDGLIAEASDLVAGYLSPWKVPVFPETTPEPISRVVAAMVATVLCRPQGLLPDTQSLTADVYSVQFAAGSTSSGPYLTAALKDRLRPYKTGCLVVELGSERF